jgi:hypothetical protein
MTELMMRLRRSPRVLLERDGYPGPGPGRMGLVMARAGAGKTAFLVGVGLDALLADQRVLHVTLHRTVEKVRSWYDDLLRQMAGSDEGTRHLAEMQLHIERRRHIHTFAESAFSAARLRDTVELLRSHMEFRPDVVILDRLDLETLPRPAVEELKAVAAEAGAELWMSCRVHREGPPAQPGHLPFPADGIEDLVDLAFRLVHEEGRMRLFVLKDGNKILERGTHLLLDPTSMLLFPEPH